MPIKRQLKVIHVELKEPFNGKRHYYFGSKKAIYETLPHEVVGISYQSLRALGDIKNRPYEGRKSTIRQGVLRTLNGNDYENENDNQ